MFAILLVLVHSAMVIQCQRCNLDEKINQWEKLYLFEADGERRFSFTCPSGFLRRNTDCILSRSTPLTSQQQCPDLESLNLDYNINICFKIIFNFTRALSAASSTVSYDVPSSSTVTNMTTTTTGKHLDVVIYDTTTSSATTQSSTVACIATDDPLPTSSSTGATTITTKTPFTRTPRNSEYLTSTESKQQCSYPISQFLATSTEKNDINLTLSIDRQSKRLYLDVYIERDVLNLRDKVYCWGEMGRIYRYRSQPISFELYIPMCNEVLTTTRYILQTQENLTKYFCTFFNPGKQKPLISNKINLLRSGGIDYTFLVPNKIFRHYGKCYAFSAGVTFESCEIVDDRTNLILLPSRGYSNISHAVKYLKDITDKVLSSPYYHYYHGVSSNNGIVSTQYCLGHNDTDSGVVWCATKIGDTTTPCENPCVDKEGNIIKRTCGGDYQTGSVWLQPSSRCSANPVHSEATLSLLSERNSIVTIDILLNVSTIMNNTSSLTAIDVDSISRILSNAENQDDAENFHSAFFDTTDRVLNTNEAVFSKAFLSRENILNAIDKYLNKTLMATTNLSYPNLAVSTKKLESSDQLLIVEQISAKFPKSMIEESPDKDNFYVAMVVFKSTKLFYQGALASHVVNLVIPSASKFFHEPISIYFEHNSKYDGVVCGYWDYRKTKPGNWSIVGVKTIRHNDSNIVECQAYHLTSFVLLGVSERVIKDLSLPILKYVSTVGCFLSLFGTTTIFFTAIAYKNWYKRRINTLQLSCVVLLEVLMLFLADIIEHTQTSCVIVGALMHYLVLAKFMLMLVIAKFHYSNFVTVMQSRNTRQYNLTYTAISLIGPLVFVISAASAFPHKYNSGNLNFCYPKDEIFIYFLVLPISIILMLNTIVFCLVMVKISKSITRSTKQKNLQVKLAFMLWFMLGLTWVLGQMAEIIKIRWLQVAFVYGFCIFGPLQGFVVFWFAVIKDKYAMTYWMKTIKQRKIQRESTTTQTLALSNTSDSY